MSGCTPAQLASEPAAPLVPATPAPQEDGQPSTGLETQSPSDPSATASATGEPGQPAQVEYSPTPGQPAAQASPTADLRRSPEDWASWPVLPERISERAREIYQRGTQMGRDPHAFSVTGDCQAIRDVMLGEFDDPRKYDLKADEQYLQETIDWFQGSFNRNGAAVRGGFTSASVLSPIHADPQMCNSGETPLGCEFRLHNPSILVISLEVWNDRAHLERYELYLRQIIEYSIEEGVLPVLMTKADMAEALKHVINPLLVQLAYEYDLPLVNFWQAVQPLPSHGIDPDRDGFHISEEAWWVKSITALKALDVVWRGVNGVESAAEPTPEITATTTPANTATATATRPAPTSIPICNPPQDCILLDLAQVEAGRTLWEGVFLLDLNSGQVAQVAEAGYRLQALSPDGNRVLLSTGGQMILMNVDGAGRTTLTDQYLNTGGLGAIWLDNDTVAMLQVSDEGKGIWVLDLNSGNWQQISDDGDSPVWLYPSPFNDRVYWEAGECVHQGDCSPVGLWVTTLEGETEPVEGVEQPVFSPDGQHFAFMDPEYTFADQFDSNFRLVVEDLQARLLSRRVISFPAATGYQVRNRLESYAWSPDGSRIMIFLDERSNYYEKSAGYHTFILKMQGGLLLEYERLIGEGPRVAWSPDGQRLLFAITAVSEDGVYTPRMQVLTPATRLTEEITLPAEWSGGEYRFVGQVFWLGQ